MANQDFAKQMLQDYAEGKKVISDEDITNNTFFVFNKNWSQARIAMWNTKSVGTYEHDMYVNQMWTFKPEPNNPGYYYLVNIKHTNYRIWQHGSKQSNVKPTDGEYMRQQLWLPFRLEMNTVILRNHDWNTFTLYKWGPKDTEFGVTPNPQPGNGSKWILVPRFDGVLKEENLWSMDNRQGSQDFSEKITVTTGVTVTNSTSFTKRVGFTVASQRALSMAVKDAGVDGSTSRSLSVELEKTTTYEEVKMWSQTREITFTAPAGKNYRVTTFTCQLRSPVESDNMKILAQYKAYESS